MTIGSEEYIRYINYTVHDRNNSNPNNNWMHVISNNNTAKVFKCCSENRINVHIEYDFDVRFSNNRILHSMYSSQYDRCTGQVGPIVLEIISVASVENCTRGEFIQARTYFEAKPLKPEVEVRILHFPTCVLVP